MRLSIDVTTEQHQHLKALAVLQGQSIKEYVLERTLPDLEAQQALKTLEHFLGRRIDAVKKGQISSKTVDDIFDSVLSDSYNG